MVTTGAVWRVSGPLARLLGYSRVLELYGTKLLDPEASFIEEASIPPMLAAFEV